MIQLLIVDDHDMNRMSLQSLLKNETKTNQQKPF